jgi:hypothetical protein
MIDYLLKFSSKRTANTFALNNGFATSDQNNKTVLISSTHDYSLIELGPHYIHEEETIDGEITVKSVSDDSYWIALRLFNSDITLPSTAQKHIIWSSNSGLPRPKNDPTIPNITWA